MANFQQDVCQKTSQTYHLAGLEEQALVSLLARVEAAANRTIQMVSQAPGFITLATPKDV